LSVAQRRIALEKEKEMAEATCDIGLIGLAVMGQNLVLNMNDHGYKVAVFNRTVSKVDEFINHEAKGTEVVGAHSVEEMCKMLKTPRRVMIMVKAGDVVDQTIEQVLPHLEKGDIIIDGGNSLFTDSNRRTKDLAAKGILFIGTGVRPSRPRSKTVLPVVTGWAKMARATTSRWSTTALSMAICS
jgi:6-phosphogluconate dehydrogenase